jgi:hypothetical protein
MGKGWEGIEASGGSLGSCEAHNVDFSPQEDRGGAAGAVGKVQSREEEGGLEPAAYAFLTSMNLQHWIDQHPAVFAAIFPIYFLCLWLLVGATISFIGGWFSLAKVYRTLAPFNGAKWGMQSGRMRWLGVE